MNRSKHPSRREYDYRTPTAELRRRTFTTPLDELDKLGSDLYRRVFEMRRKGLSLRETGLAIGRTRERVRQMEWKALRRLSWLDERRPFHN